MTQILSCLFISMCVASAFFGCLQESAATNNSTDREALLHIKARLSDPLGGALSSWNDTIHFCQWYGVSCGLRHQRVTELKLPSSNLTGTISPYIGNLSFLRVLVLSNNSLTGTIPLEIARLQRLLVFQVFTNSIRGVFPSNISSCSLLRNLRVAYNKLVGVIPHEIGNLQELQILDMEENHFTGTIPANVGNLSSSLSVLFLGGNRLAGSIPHSLSNLKFLTNLSLYENNLSGIVPSFIYNYSNMVELDLSQNNFQGNLPSDIGSKLPNLVSFSIFENMFTGTIPASVSNLHKLQYLQLHNNSLHGQVPSLHNLQNLIFLDLGANFLGNGVNNTDLDFVSSLANATMLQELTITGNNFKGAFPQIICNFSMLFFLGLGNNKISGQIPPCIENLGSLQYLVGAQNKLSGNIPPGIGKLQYLNSIFLEDNQLSGIIPSSLGNLSLLTQLDLSQNNFEGNIPSTLGNCSYLQSLDLYQNKLDGTIPTQIMSIPTLSVELNLSNNHLSGFLPDAVGQLTSLGTLDLSENMLSGELPSSLSACTGLETLHLEGNHFQGDINDAFQGLFGLLDLDLSRNNFSGKIPKYLARLQLQNLNLSYNNFEGEVPTGGVFNNVKALSLQGNSKVCGGKPELKLRRCDFNKMQIRKSSHRKRLIFAILFGTLGTILLVALLVSLYVFWYIRRKKEPIPTSNDSGNFPNVSYQNLQKATNGFSAENIIGRGAFGVVYKGILEQDRPVVAIKIFNLEKCGALRSFMAECDALRNIRHRNLVTVITACSSVDYQGNEFKALVYEYMVNGSLEDWLHPTKELISVDIETNSIPRTLNFHQRLDIAIDVASAMEYLHHHHSEYIVHCDIKPSNVLLDKDLVAHVSDFGLARFLTEDTSSSSSNHSRSVGIKGTIGYTPPEYGFGNGVSTSGDVYSFGILLLEMFTGKRPTDDMFREGLTLHQHVKEAFPDKVTEILDDMVSKDITEQQTKSNTTVLEAMISILGLALSCTSELPQERLNMSDVSSRLSAIRKKLLGDRLQQQQRPRIPAGNST